MSSFLADFTLLQWNLDRNNHWIWGKPLQWSSAFVLQVTKDWVAKVANMDLLGETIACTMANASGVTVMVMQLLVIHSHYAVEWVTFYLMLSKFLLNTIIFIPWFMFFLELWTQYGRSKLWKMCTWLLWKSAKRNFWWLQAMQMSARRTLK